MPTLLISLKKKSDGSVTLSCTRPDGSIAWQKVDSRHARFFPYHDLTHYAVESTLGHRRGFYGLIADGWDFSDFSSEWPRGPIPADANPSELIVGLLDAERSDNQHGSAAEFNANAASFLSQLGSPALSLVDDRQLAAIRAKMAELFDQWNALPSGQSMNLELVFDSAK